MLAPITALRSRSLRPPDATVRGDPTPLDRLHRATAVREAASGVASVAGAVATVVLAAVAALETAARPVAAAVADRSSDAVETRVAEPAQAMAESAARVALVRRTIRAGSPRRPGSDGRVALEPTDRMATAVAAVAAGSRPAHPVAVAVVAVAAASTALAPQVVALRAVVHSGCMCTKAPSRSLVDP